MITDDLQDQAALYALGALDAQESAAFETVMTGNAELQAMVREMREAAGDLGSSVPAKTPPSEVKQRVLREIALEKQSEVSTTRTATTSFNWIPWAIAALFLLFCGLLALDRKRLEQELATERAVDPLTQVTMVALASPDHPDTKANVAWQPDRQSGVITISNLPAAGKGRDYQLWAVDTDHKDPINAGIIHVDQNGVARGRFKPDQTAGQIKAFALSLEREGGVPKREGPIVLIGSI